MSPAMTGEDPAWLKVARVSYDEAQHALQLDDQTIPDDRIVFIEELQGTTFFAYVNIKKSGQPDSPPSPPVFQGAIHSSPPNKLPISSATLSRFSARALQTWASGDRSIEALHAIISTRSGTGTASETYARLVRPFLQAVATLAQLPFSQIVTSELHTTSPQTIPEWTTSTLIPAALAGKQTMVLLLAGDGGIQEILAAFHSSEAFSTHDSSQNQLPFANPIIGLIPTGTGNALALSSGISADATMGLATLARGLPKVVPEFSVRFTPPGNAHSKQMHGVVVCSWGLHASLVHESDTPEFRKHGDQRFALAAQELMHPAGGSSMHQYAGTVEVREPGNGSEEAKWRALGGTEHTYVLATLMNQLAAGFTISPAGKPLDGRLRLIRFGPVEADDAMGLMTLAFQGGKHVEDERVEYLDVDAVRIRIGEDEGERFRVVCLDGAIVKVEPGEVIEISNGVRGGDGRCGVSLMHLQR